MRWMEAVAVALLFVCPAQAAPEGRSQPITAMLRFPNDAMLSFEACRRWIAESAKRYNPIVIETVVTGPIQRLAGGLRTSPLFVRIVYEREGGRETRKTRMTCTIDATGSVTDVAEQP